MHAVVLSHVKRVRVGSTVCAQTLVKLLRASVTSDRPIYPNIDEHERISNALFVVLQCTTKFRGTWDGIGIQMFRISRLFEFIREVRCTRLIRAVPLTFARIFPIFSRGRPENVGSVAWRESDSVLLQTKRIALPRLTLRLCHRVVE